MFNIQKSLHFLITFTHIHNHKYIKTFVLTKSVNTNNTLIDNIETASW